VSAIVFLPITVVFPIRLCLADISLLALLRAAAEQNYNPVALPSTVDAITRTKIDLVFENA
jgi:hypothetical protein